MVLSRLCLKISWTLFYLLIKLAGETGLYSPRVFKVSVFVKFHLLHEAFTTISRHPDSKQMSELFITFPVSVYHFGYLITYYLVKLIGRLISIYIYLPMMIISSPRQGTATCTQIIFPPLLNSLNNKDGGSHINKAPSEPEVSKLNSNHRVSS